MVVTVPSALAAATSSSKLCAFAGTIPTARRSPASAVDDLGCCIDDPPCWYRVAVDACFRVQAAGPEGTTPTGHSWQQIDKWKEPALGARPDHSRCEMDIGGSTNRGRRGVERCGGRPPRQTRPGSAGNLKRTRLRPENREFTGNPRILSGGIANPGARTATFFVVCRQIPYAQEGNSRFRDHGSSRHRSGYFRCGSGNLGLGRPGHPRTSRQSRRSRFATSWGDDEASARRLRRAGDCSGCAAGEPPAISVHPSRSARKRNRPSPRSKTLMTFTAVEPS